jgi:hypothetical protein
MFEGIEPHRFQYAFINKTPFDSRIISPLSGSFKDSGWI